MGGHRRYRRGHDGGYGQAGFSSRWIGKPSRVEGAPPRLKPIIRVALIVALVVWSLLAWIAYVLVDPALNWVAVTAGILVDTGKGIATATGVGEQVGSAAAGLNARGFWGQAITLLRLVLKPGIIIVWAIGALALVAAPVILPRIGMILGRRH